MDRDDNGTRRSRKVVASVRGSNVRLSGRASEQVGIALQIQRPTLVAGNTVAHALPAVAVALQFPMLELDAGPVWRLGCEPHFPFTGLFRVGLNLPSWADVPTQQDPVGWLVG